MSSPHLLRLIPRLIRHRCLFPVSNTTTNLSTVSSDDPGLHKSPITDALWKQRRAEREMYEAMGPNANDLPAQTLLQTKSPADSAVRVEYPFRRDRALRDRYVNCWGALDKGVLFEDLDALAGNVSWRHAVMGNGVDCRPPMLVTAAVDEVRLTGSLRAAEGEEDMYMKGSVVFVGKSSMLVRCEVGHTTVAVGDDDVDDDKDNDHGDSSSGADAAAGGGGQGREGGRGREEKKDEVAPLMVADFLYVARDRVSGKASPVNRLRIPDSDVEGRKLYAAKLSEVESQKANRAMGAEAKLKLDESRKKQAHARLAKSQALIRMPALNHAAIHHHHHHHHHHQASSQVRSGGGPGGGVDESGDDDAMGVGCFGVLVEKTELHNTLICQPQQRNTSGRVFGGFLMRRAYELALATAFCFAGQTPRFLWSDEISFTAPVSIGDLLRLDARVILSEPTLKRPRIHCEVFASVLRPTEGTSVLSNRFAFSFCLDEQQQKPEQQQQQQSQQQQQQLSQQQQQQQQQPQHNETTVAAAAMSTTTPVLLPLLPLLPFVRPSRTGEALRQLELLAASRQIPDWSAPAPAPTK